MLQGLKKPVDCPAFGTRCTPMNPLGAPMVSTEGACAAYYQYRRTCCRSATEYHYDDRFVRLPAPLKPRDRIVLGHGSGGRLSAELLRDVFLPLFSNPLLDRLDDQAIFEIGGARVAFTTDSFVVKPLFFPGGDIGSLAVHGTVNDLAMGGAQPLFLSAGFILEEGFPTETLQRDCRVDGARPPRPPASRSSPATPRSSKRERATGFSSTPPESALCRTACGFRPISARPGDRVILSGAIGDHGIAILAQREGLEFETRDRERFGGAARAGGGRCSTVPQLRSAACAIPPEVGYPAH